MSNSGIKKPFEEKSSPPEEPRIVVSYAPDVEGVRYENLSLWTPETASKQKTVLIRPFTCEFKPGDRVAIKGPSGCGKTTLIRSGKNMHVYGSGRIIFNAGLENIKNADAVNTVIIPQKAIMPLRNLKGIITYPAMHPEKFDDGAVIDALHKVGLARILAESDEKLREKLHDNRIDGSMYVNQLSGGQQQRLMVARAIIHQPKLIALDEPTSALGRSAPEMYKTLIRNLPEDVIMLSVLHTNELDRFHNLSAEITENGEFVVKPMTQAAAPVHENCTATCSVHCPK